MLSLCEYHRKVDSTLLKVNIPGEIQKLIQKNVPKADMHKVIFQEMISDLKLFNGIVNYDSLTSG